VIKIFYQIFLIIWGLITTGFGTWLTFIHREKSRNKNKSIYEHG